MVKQWKSVKYHSFKAATEMKHIQFIEKHVISRSDVHGDVTEVGAELSMVTTLTGGY